MPTRSPAASKVPVKRRARAALAHASAAAPDTRARILEAAYGVLRERGYDKLTQLAVCEAAGISQGHLTYYFPTRATLQLGLAEHCVYREVAQMLRVALDGAAKPVPAELAAGLAAQLRDRDKPRVMLGLLMAADGDARIKPALREFMRNARGLVARVLTECGAPASEANITLLHANLIGLAILNFACDDKTFAASLDDVIPMLMRNWSKVGASN